MQSLFKPIEGISAAGKKGKEVDKIDWNSDFLYFSEEIHSIVGKNSNGIKRISLCDENKLPMGEFEIIPSISVFRHRKQW